MPGQSRVKALRRRSIRWSKNLQQGRLPILGARECFLEKMTFKLFYRPGNYRFYPEGHRNLKGTNLLDSIKYLSCLIPIAQGYYVENLVQYLLCLLGSELQRTVLLSGLKIAQHSWWNKVRIHWYLSHRLKVWLWRHKTEQNSQNNSR